MKLDDYLTAISECPDELVMYENNSIWKLTAELSIYDNWPIFLKADFHVGKDVLYLIVDALEHDTPYRRHFGLPLSY